MRHVLIVYSKYFLILHILLYHLIHSFILGTFDLFTLYFFAHTFAEWQQKCISFFSFSRVSQLHRRKKGQVPAAFWPLFKNATFEFSNYESFAAFIMPKHSSDGNFRPFWAFINFLQMFKVGNFAS